MSNYTPTHAQAGKTTAQALKAKVLLSKGDYVNAALLADEVIQTAGNYGYGLVDFMSIFSDMFDSPEVLFAPYVSNYEEQCSFILDRTTYSSYSQKIADAMDPTPGKQEKVTIPVLPPRFLHRTSSQLLSKTGNILTVPMMTARAIPTTSCVWEKYIISMQKRKPGREAIILRQPVPVCKPFWMPMSREYMT